MEASTSLREGLSLLRAMRGNLASEDLNGEVYHAIDRYLARKILDFEEVIVLCLGLELECLSERSRINPGQQCRISTHLWNHRHVFIDQAAFTLHVPKGWTVRSGEPAALDADPGSTGVMATWAIRS
jgi:hypothetical protein